MQCPICLDVIESNNIDRINCGHTFCYTCINEWLRSKNSCPLCRACHKSKENTILPTFLRPVDYVISGQSSHDYLDRKRTYRRLNICKRRLETLQHGHWEPDAAAPTHACVYDRDSGLTWIMKPSRKWNLFLF